ncbi:MAG: hypothetical protein IPO67_18505 [Deltaproteobacteria bacterium]|nr:hypothetical protein [Deltaproteobacteria bacterium]
MGVDELPLQGGDRALGEAEAGAQLLKLGAGGLELELGGGLLGELLQSLLTGLVDERAHHPGRGGGLFSAPGDAPGELLQRLPGHAQIFAELVLDDLPAAKLNKGLLQVRLQVPQAGPGVRRQAHPRTGGEQGQGLDVVVKLGQGALGLLGDRGQLLQAGELGL